MALGGPPLGHVQVLFVFSTTCQYCEASLPAWKRIAGELDRNEQVEILGLSIDSVDATREYVDKHGLEYAVVSFADRRLRALYRAGITPQTLIVDGDGKVSYARIGAVTDPVVIDSILNATATVAAHVLEGPPNYETAR